MHCWSQLTSSPLLSEWLRGLRNRFIFRFIRLNCLFKQSKRIRERERTQSIKNRTESLHNVICTKQSCTHTTLNQENKNAGTNPLTCMHPWLLSLLNQTSVTESANCQATTMLTKVQRKSSQSQLHPNSSAMKTRIKQMNYRTHMWDSLLMTRMLDDCKICFHVKMLSKKESSSHDEKMCKTHYSWQQLRSCICQSKQADISTSL